jgi:ATP-dependent exoDNAse (exonuclease V) alpha subunit
MMVGMTQETALNIMKSGHNVFLTGGPGAGKTHVINEYVNYLKDYGVTYCVTAPTGIAASHINGMTIHSFFGIGIRETLSDYEVEALLEKKYLWDRMKNLKVVIIDEISMLSPGNFRSIDQILRAFKMNDEPFGGIQMIVSGDFFQLPPVSKTKPEERFVFQTELWNTMDLHMCYLDGSYRHEDATLLEILDEIRRGEVSESSMQHFRDRYRKKDLIDGAVTKLYTHNQDVDSINKQALEDLDSPKKIFKAHTTGAKKWVERIFDTSLVLPELELKKDALVFFIKNNYEDDYINGTLGTIVDFDTFNNPIVRTTNGEEIKATRQEWVHENNDGKTLATVKQIPLRLAWAITIHKSQGMTLDAAEIDLSKAFEPGQGYVALSRIKTLRGLTLMGLNEMALSVEPKVKSSDRIFKASSNQLAKHYTSLEPSDHQANHQRFMEAVGGSKAKGSEQKAKANVVKTSTLEKTRDLIREKKTVAEIAKKRDLKEATVFNHIERIIENWPETDISHLQPDSAIIESVEAAVAAIKKRNIETDFTEGGDMKLKSIFMELDEKIDYNEIKLALLFLE